MTAGDERTYSCQYVVERVTDYLEDTLTPHERDLFERHLDTCPHCIVYIEQMRIAIESLGTLASDELDAPTRAKLVDVFRDWKEKSG
jgi:anti-sigma factor RsiW